MAQTIINASDLPDHIAQELLDCEESIKNALIPISKRYNGNILLGGLFGIYLRGLDLMHEGDNEELVIAYENVIKCMRLNLEITLKDRMGE